MSHDPAYLGYEDPMQLSQPKAQRLCKVSPVDDLVQELADSRADAERLRAELASAHDFSDKVVDNRRGWVARATTAEAMVNEAASTLTEARVALEMRTQQLAERDVLIEQLYAKIKSTEAQASPAAIEGMVARRTAETVAEMKRIQIAAGAAAVLLDTIRSA